MVCIEECIYESQILKIFSWGYEGLVKKIGVKNHWICWIVGFWNYRGVELVLEERLLSIWMCKFVEV